MNKGLEALEEIKKIKREYYSKFPSISEEIDIIEKELKEYEMEHTLRIRLENINYELVREKQENEKKLKALEIIKEKRVDCLVLVLSQTYVEYNDMCEIEKDKLTQEEYDLLKEVLKDESDID